MSSFHIRSDNSSHRDFVSRSPLDLRSGFIHRNHKALRNCSTRPLFSLAKYEVVTMMRKTAPHSSKLPLDHHWLVKVRIVMRKARKSRERANVWGKELTRYLNKLSC
jgi:hypothetical protein